MDLQEIEEWRQTFTQEVGYKAYQRDIDYVNLIVSEIERCHETMREFCERRDKGQVISHYTYMKFRKILDEK